MINHFNTVETKLLQ